MALNVQTNNPTIVFESEKYAAAGLRAFFDLMKHWKVGNTDARTLLGRPKERRFYNWKKGEVSSVPADTMRRIGYLLGVHKDLRILFNNPQNIYGWINKENKDFGGQTPLERMVAGDVTDLAHVRQYLDAMRGGWV